jgi:hypothetical protein
MRGDRYGLVVSDVTTLVDPAFTFRALLFGAYCHIDPALGVACFERVMQ